MNKCFISECYILAIIFMYLCLIIYYNIVLVVSIMSKSYANKKCVYLVCHRCG